jgi:hypothetical protein
VILQTDQGTARRYLTTAALLLAALACGRSQQVLLTPLPCPPEGISRTMAGPPEEWPRLAEPFVLPKPTGFSNGTHHITARFLVDTTGKAVGETITVCGVERPRYASDLVRTIQSTSFTPGRRDGAPIVAPFFIEYTFLLDRRP